MAGNWQAANLEWRNSPSCWSSSRFWESGIVKPPRSKACLWIDTKRRNLKQLLFISLPNPFAFSLSSPLISVLLHVFIDVEMIFSVYVICSFDLQYVLHHAYLMFNCKALWGNSCCAMYCKRSDLTSDWTQQCVCVCVSVSLSPSATRVKSCPVLRHSCLLLGRL